MQIVCPVCQAVHHIREGQVLMRRTVATCRRCGSPIAVDPEAMKAAGPDAPAAETGEVPRSETPAPVPPDPGERSCPGLPGPQLMEPREAAGSPGDPDDGPPPGIPGKSVSCGGRDEPPAPPGREPPGSPVKAAAPWRRCRKGFLLAACLTILAMVVLVQFVLPLLEPPAPVRPQPPRQLPGQQQAGQPPAAPAASETPMVRLAANLPTAGPAAFDIVYALPHDKRLVSGLTEAMFLYDRLFVKGLEPGKPPEVDITQLDGRQYAVSCAFAVVGETQKIRLVLSNEASDVRENVRRLEQALQQYAEVRKNAHLTAGAAPFDHEAASARIAEQISAFDLTDMLIALREIEQRVTAGEAGSRLLAGAGEIYSWLAVFKNRNENRRLSDALAAQALSSYLLGRLDRQAEAGSSLHEGLLLLAMDYPAASEEALDPSHPSEQLLRAFIRYDFEEMKALAGDPKVNKRLLGYLLTRAFKSSGQDDLADEYCVKLMTNYPDFLLAREYVVRNAKLGVIRQHIDGFIEDLLEKHLSLVNELTDTQWLTQDPSLEAEVRKNVTRENSLDKWFKLHCRIVDRSPRMKGPGLILAGEFFRTFLLDDMFNAIASWYRVEDEYLGRRAEATRIFETTRASYPGKWIVSLLGLKEVKDHQGRVAYLKDFPVAGADRCILSQLLERDIIQGKEKNRVLRNLRAQQNPDAPGCFGLYRHYKDVWNRPAAERHLRSAMSLDPYNYRYYEEMLKTGGGEEVIEKGNQRVGHLYGFLWAVADCYQKNRKLDSAVDFYEKAISAGPAQQAAYRDLGKVYQARKEYDKAVETWERYLKYDTTTLSAVVIQNLIGSVWMEREDYARAYNIYLESQKSGQAMAILGFAEASEKTGKLLQAEQSYQRAAQRYPQGRTPVELAIFYLRQNSPDTAFQVIREYKRFNRPNYYMERLVDHCSQSGHPEKAIELVKTIEGTDEKNRQLSIQLLTNAYMVKKHFAIAAELIGPFMAANPWTMEKYWSSMLQGNLATPAELPSKGIPPNGRTLPTLGVLARYLLENEHYDPSLAVFSELFRNPDFARHRERPDSVAQFALAWCMGSRDEGIKKEILDALKATEKDPWLEARVLFLLGELDQNRLMAQASTEDKRGQANYYLGMMELKKGNKTDALKYLLMSIEYLKEGQEDIHAIHVTKELASL